MTLDETLLPDPKKPAWGNPEIWAAFFALWLLFYAVTCYLLDVFTVFVLFTVAFVGVVALVQSGLAFARTRIQRAAICLLAVVATWYVWVFVPVRELGLATRFWLEEPQYAEAVKELSSGGKPACVTTQQCVMDAGPPARLAFPWGGITGSWSGIVYDPTADILDLERNKGVFGGGLSACRPVRQDYFLCSFT